MTTFSAVVTTGIYCRPGCGAKPLAENVRTFEFAAGAEAAGFRACLRCRPYRVAGPIGPDAPELVCRAVQLIIDGVLDEGTEAALGARLAISPRHLRRLFNDCLGATPGQLARSRRAHFARRLLGRLRSDPHGRGVRVRVQQPAPVQSGHARRVPCLPSELRGRRRRADRLAADGGLTVRLPFQPPFSWDRAVGYLADRAVPGVESVEDRVYRRTISLDGAAGLLEVHPGGADHLLLRAHLPYWEGLIHVVERAGRMVGVDDGEGLRVPGAWGAVEVAIHAIVAAHCGLAEARARMGALVRDCGPAVPGLTHGLTHLFPSAEVLAGRDLAAAGLPQPTAEGIRTLAARVAAEVVVLDGSVDSADLMASLTAIPGIEAAPARQIALRLGRRPAQ